MPCPPRTMGAPGTRIAALATLGPQRSGSPTVEEISKGATMDEIKGIARVKFHPGKVEEWKRLTEEAMEIVRTRDTGTLQYEIFFNEDESEALGFQTCRAAL